MAQVILYACERAFKIFLFECPSSETGRSAFDFFLFQKCLKTMKTTHSIILNLLIQQLGVHSCCCFLHSTQLLLTAAGSIARTSKNNTILNSQDVHNLTSHASFYDFFYIHFGKKHPINGNDVEFDFIQFGMYSGRFSYFMNRSDEQKTRNINTIFHHFPLPQILQIYKTQMEKHIHFLFYLTNITTKISMSTVNLMKMQK